MTSEDDHVLEKIAAEVCSEILAVTGTWANAPGIESAVILAFIMGAAWAHNRPDLLERAKITMEKMKAGGHLQ